MNSTDTPTVADALGESTEQALSESLREMAQRHMVEKPDDGRADERWIYSEQWVKDGFRPIFKRGFRCGDEKFIDLSKRRAKETPIQRAHAETARLNKRISPDAEARRQFVEGI